MKSSEASLVKIDKSSTIPIYEQIASSLRDLVMRSLLQPGDEMPSAQSLAQTLVINPAIVQRAYSDLEKQRILRAVANGSYVITESAAKGASQRMGDAIQVIAEAALSSRRQGITWDQIDSLMEMLKAYEHGKHASGDLITTKSQDRQCPYCRQKIEFESAVQCLLCKTAHHEECWSETGNCSVFGCTGRVPLRS